LGGTLQGQTEEVTFRFRPPGPATNVYLAGTFNGWAPDKDRMTDEDGDGVYEITLDLAPGRYEYKFVADGTWYTDESASDFAPDGFGGRNSVLYVGGAAPEPKETYPITFRYAPSGPGPHNVFLAGTFNGWAPDKDRMTDEDGDGVYEITVQLAPGRYEYKFVVDGTWYTDETAGEFAPDGFGGRNSVLRVEPGGAVSSGPAATGKLHRVRFTYTPPRKPQKIFLAGSFNDWNPTATPMEDPDGDGTYEVTLILPGGSYPYKFVVDGNWVQDPKATESVPDGFGGQNSVVRVDDRFPEIRLEEGDGEIFTEGLGHRRTLAERNILSDTEVLFRTRAYRGDVEGVDLAVRTDGTWERLGMEPFSSDATFTHYEALLTSAEPLGIIRYAFVFRDGPREVWLGADGIRDDPSGLTPFVLDPATAEHLRVPEWARDAVIYQIFPERFYNGDPGNDPDFKEWYYEGKRRLPRVGPYNGEYYHLVKDWYDVSGLQKSPYRSDGKPDYFSFYGGDLAGVMEKLPYLADLGITAIYFNPIFQARSNHKYDAADYRKIDPHFGDAELFAELVRKAHELGIRIILDTVFNHTGDTHWAFQDCVKNGPKSRYWNWYEWKKWPLPDPIPPDFKPIDYYACWWGFGSLPELNFDLSRPNPDENPIQEIADAQPNMEVVRELLDTVRYWIETFDVDGFRLDVPNEVPFWFWKLFAQEVRRLKPDAYIVAEIWGDASEWIRPDLVDATMNYRYFRDPVLSWIAHGKGSAADFDRALAPGRFAYPPQSQQVMMNLLGSHDTPRFLTEAGGDVRRLMLAALFQMTYVGIPHVYYGDEVAMEGGKDPDCRRPFYWKWEEEPERRRVHDHYRRLIRLRREHAALRRGAFRTLLADGPVYAYARWNAEEALVVVLNNSPEEREVRIPLGEVSSLAQEGAYRDLLEGGAVPAVGGELSVVLGPYSGRVLQAPGE
jgi:glycosidase